VVNTFDLVEEPLAFKWLYDKLKPLVILIDLTELADVWVLNTLTYPIPAPSIFHTVTSGMPDMTDIEYGWSFRAQVPVVNTFDLVEEPLALKYVFDYELSSAFLLEHLLE